MKGILITVLALCTLAAVAAAARVSQESNRQGKGESFYESPCVVASSLHF